MNNEETYHEEDPSEPVPENITNPAGTTNPAKPAQTKINFKTESGRSTTTAAPVTRIHTMIIIGQIEGHLILPPKNKTPQI